jgi:hypothetical protein
MQDQLIALAYVLAGAVVLAILSRLVVRPRERVLVALSYAAHVLGAQAQIWVTRNVFGGGDMFLYYREGQAVANALRFGPDGTWVEVLKLLFQQDQWLPVHVTGLGSSTASMTALSALLLLMTDDSLAATCSAVAILSFFGKLVMYVALRRSLHEDVHQRVLVACLLVPSVVFWSSGLLKEAVAMAGIGWLLLGMQEILRQRVVRGAVVAVIGLVPIALVKPYVLVAFAVSAAVWYYWHRARHTRAGGMLARPLQIAVGLGMGVGGVVVLGQFFPRFAFDALGEQLALQQALSQAHAGGSTYTLGDPTQSTLLGQLAFAPEALLASLFRPFILEASNLQIFVNALETSALTLLLVRLLWRERWVRLWTHVSASPVLMFFLVFTVTFGVAVGLGTTNLGTLSRYRMPLVPFFAGLILVLDLVVARGRTMSRASTPVPANPKRLV